MEENRSVSEVYSGPYTSDLYAPAPTGYASAWGSYPLGGLYPSSAYSGYATGYSAGYSYPYPWPTSFDPANHYYGHGYAHSGYPIGTPAVSTPGLRPEVSCSPASSYASDVIDRKPVIASLDATATVVTTPVTSSRPSSKSSTKEKVRESSSSSSSSSDDSAKPPYSYIALVAMAISNEPSEMATLREIIGYIQNRFPYYRNKATWQRSLRHCLTLNDCFVKRARRVGDKGHPWAIDADFRDMFDNGSLMRRRYRFKEGSANWNRSRARAAKTKSSRTSAAATGSSSGTSGKMDSPLDPRLPSLPPQHCPWMTPTSEEQRGALDSTLASDTSAIDVTLHDSSVISVADVSLDASHAASHVASNITTSLFLDCEQTQDYWSYSSVCGYGH